MCRAFRRLTIRGELRLNVRLARNVALTSSTVSNHLFRFLGLDGVKGSAQGLLLVDQLHVSDDGQVLVRYSEPRRTLVQQPSHRVVHQHPAEDSK